MTRFRKGEVVYYKPSRELYKVVSAKKKHTLAVKKVGKTGRLYGLYGMQRRGFRKTQV